MNYSKCIGMDVHKDTISIAVMDSRGKLVMESILETKAATILQFIQVLRGSLFVTFEEGTWAAWFYDLLKPHVTAVVACNPRSNALLKDGNKSNRIDAQKLADLLRGKSAKAGKIGSSRHGYLGVFLADKEDLTLQPADPGEVTVLLQQIGHGDAHAVERLIPLVLHELRTLAKLQLRNERPDHTLQPTALVNEAYIRLVTDQARNWQSRAHFIGVSASIMRRILVDHARRRQALKRGGLSRSALDTENCAALSDQQAEELLTLNMALDRLEEMSHRQRRVVELRYFGGLSLEETAEVLNVSPITVKRDWLAAKTWLKGQMQHQPVG